MGIQVEIFELDASGQDLGDAANEEWIDDRLLEPREHKGQRQRSARRAVERLLEKRRLRQQLSDFLP